MFNLGGTELLVVGGIILLLFGPAKLPALAGSIGKSIKEFRHSVKDIVPTEPEPAPAKPDSQTTP
jgi:sec-independent protein translocase protein TatA